MYYTNDISCARCCLSGLIIKSTDPIVAWTVDCSEDVDYFPGDYDYEKMYWVPYIPTSFPVFGFLDDGFQVVDKDKNRLINTESYQGHRDRVYIVVCHLDLFKYPRSLWDEVNDNKLLYDTVIQFHQEFKSLYPSISDDQKYETCSLFFNAKKINHYNSREFLIGFRELYKFERKRFFERQILDLIIQGPSYPNLMEVCLNLECMLSCYDVLPRLIDRFILPFEYCIYGGLIQDELQIRWFNEINKKLNPI